MRRVYVYALVEQRARSFRIADRTVSIVECHQSSTGSIYAAVELREDLPELSESSLKVQHEIVAALAQRFDAILPVRFGAFIAEQELFRIVQLRCQILTEALASVRGHEQMTVRVFGREPAGTDLKGADPSGTAYLERRRAAQQGPLPRVAERICNHVRAIATREFLEQGRPNRAVLHHLIPKGRSGDYVELVQAAASEAQPAERVTVSGPFAPFAFVPAIWA